MLAKRIIPCLDVREGRVVKGTRFVDLQDPSLIRTGADRFGSQCIIAAIDQLRL